MRESSVEILAIEPSVSNETNLEAVAELLVHHLSRLLPRVLEVYEGRERVESVVR